MRRSQFIQQICTYLQVTYQLYQCWKGPFLFPIGTRSYHWNKAWNAFLFKYRNEGREKVPIYEEHER